MAKRILSGYQRADSFDYNARIRSFDMRPGSANDKAVFNYSDFGVRLPHTIPAGNHIVAGA
jgi:hypothetical protein